MNKIRAGDYCADFWLFVPAVTITQFLVITRHISMWGQNLMGERILKILSPARFFPTPLIPAPSLQKGFCDNKLLP
jgi:hypothetical protein